MLPPLSLLCPPREFGPPMKQLTRTVQAPHVWECCYLDNRSAVGVMAQNTQHNNTSFHKLLFGEKTRLHQVLWGLWYFHDKTNGGYLSHGWEGIGNCDMEEKGIVVRHCFPGFSAGAPLPVAQSCLLPEPAGSSAAGLRWRAAGLRWRAAGLRWKTTPNHGKQSLSPPFCGSVCT